MPFAAADYRSRFATPTFKQPPSVGKQFSAPWKHTKKKKTTIVRMTQTNNPELPSPPPQRYGISRLIQHRNDCKLCQCTTCYLDVNRLPPPHTKADENASYRFHERAVKKAKRTAKKAVKKGNQSTINDFFTHGTKVQRKATKGKRSAARTKGAQK